MAQATVIQNGKKRKCEHCSKICISDVGMSHHMRIKHPEKIKLYSCYTCQKDFTTEDMQTKHFSTVLHQFNCKKYDGADSQIENITHWLEIQDEERYYAYLYNIDLPENPRMSRNQVPINELRTSPVEIPLEGTSKLPDPRVLERREENHSDVTNTENNQDVSQPEEEVDVKPPNSSPINTDVQRTQEYEKEAKNCESIHESDTLNELDSLFEEQRIKDSCTVEHIIKETNVDPTRPPRPSSKNTVITVVTGEEQQLDSTQPKICTFPNENCENTKKMDTQNRILSFDSDLNLAEMCENLTDLPKEASPTNTDVHNILDKIYFVERTQEKKRKLENSIGKDELEAAKIIKTDTEYPELTTIELETLAELLNYLPTTLANK